MTTRCELARAKRSRDSTLDICNPSPLGWGSVATDTKNPTTARGFSYVGDGGLVRAVGARGRDTVAMVCPILMCPWISPPDPQQCTLISVQATIPATVSRSKQLVDGTANLAAVRHAHGEACVAS